jgi:hypothetical protein
MGMPNYIPLDAVIKVDTGAKTVNLQKVIRAGGVMHYDGRVPWLEVSTREDLSRQSYRRGSRRPTDVGLRNVRIR